MAPFIIDDEISRIGIGPSSGEGSSFWAPSLDPRNEERMPMVLKTWRRWSNTFDKEKEFDMLKFDMTTLCPACTSSTWELIDAMSPIQCRTCGHIPTSTNNKTTYSHRCSKRLPTTYTEEVEAESSSSNASSSRSRSYSEVSAGSYSFHDGEGEVERERPGVDEISEHDFASPKTKEFEKVLGSHRNSGIRSVRQSMIEPVRKPRWFEEKKDMVFHFKLTPRGRASPLSSSSSSPSTTTTSSSTDESGAGSSKPLSQQNTAQSSRSIPIHELTHDPTSWQRILTSALFLMKEDSIPRPGEQKVLDLGLAMSRGSGGKHLAMKHHSSTEHENIMQNEKSEAKRVLWRVVVKPIGSGSQERARGSLLPR